MFRFWVFFEIWTRDCKWAFPSLLGRSGWGHFGFKGSGFGTRCSFPLFSSFLGIFFVFFLILWLVWLVLIWSLTFVDFQAWLDLDLSWLIRKMSGFAPFLIWLYLQDIKTQTNDICNIIKHIWVFLVVLRIKMAIKWWVKGNSSIPQTKLCSPRAYNHIK